MRVGIEYNWDAVSYGSTQVVLRVNIWTQNMFSMSDNQTLSFSGFTSNTAFPYSNTTGSTSTYPDSPRFRITKTYTFSPYSTWGSSPGTRTITASVSGVDAAPGIAPSNSATATIPARPATNPGVPSVVSSTPGNGSVTISYSAPSFYGGANPPVSGDGVTIIRTEYSTDNTATYATAPASPFTITGLTNGTEKTVWLRTVNSSGLVSSWTSVASTPRTTPGALSSISSSPNNGSITVSYGGVTDNGGDAESYKYSTDNVEYQAAPASPFNVNGANGTAITVYIRASNGAGNGPTASTTSTPRTVPSAPTSFSANAATLGQITLSWAAPSSNGGNGVTSYVLRNGGTVLQNTSATSYTHTGLSPNTDYSYTVTAANAAGEGASSSVSATTIGGRVKIWNGSSWVTIFPQVWNGSAWVTAQARIWNGTEWKFGL
jgi:titin